MSQAAKAAPDVIKAEVAELLSLKGKYKEVAGSDYVAPVSSAPAAVPAAKKTKEPTSAPETKKESAEPSKKAQIKEDKKTASAESVVNTSAPAVVEEPLDLTSLVLYTGTTSSADDILRCFLVAEANNKDLKSKQQAPAGKYAGTCKSLFVWEHYLK